MLLYIENMKEFVRWVFYNFLKRGQNFTSADQLEAIMRLWVVRLSHNRCFTDNLVAE